MRIEVWTVPLAQSALCIILLAGCAAHQSLAPNVPAPQAGPLALDATRRQPFDALAKNMRARPAVAAPTGPRGRTWSSRAITQDVFFADTVNGVIDIFDFRSRQQSGEIAGLNSPEGLATDTSANLYVADTLNQTIEIFAKPYSGVPAILGDSGYFPVGVHVAADGTVYVANICSGSGQTCAGPGNTVTYAPGSSTPTPLHGGPAHPYFVATDRRGNVWVDGETAGQSPSPIIGYFTARTKRFVRVDISFVFPGGIAFDRHGNLLLDDQGGAPNGASILYVYPPDSTIPKRSIALQTDGDDIVDVALGTADERVFAPGYFSGTAAIITYPEGVLVNTLTPASLGALEAVAVVPGTLP